MQVKLGGVATQENDAAMPYFVYYVSQHADSSKKLLEHLDTFDNFKAARSMAREQRAALKAEGSDRDCRLIFAKTQVEAEKLLSAPREERVIGED